MKPKEEILKMTKEELSDYKWNDDLNISEEKKDTNFNCSDCYDCSYCSDCFNCSNCSDCSDCSYCSYCSDCFNCSDCLYCRNLKDKEDGYWICNVEVTKEEFEAKKKELGIK